MNIIDSQEHFVQEYQTLLIKINQNITDLAQYQKVEMDKPSKGLTEKLNRLKLHRTKLRNFLLTYGEASEEAWIAARKEARNIFQKALEEYLLPFEELTNS